MPTAEENLAQLGLTLPELAPPVANYVPWVQTGNLLYLSGQVSRRPDGTNLQGKLGATMTKEEGYEAAKTVGIYIIAAAKAALGDLERVRRVVKLLAMVNSAADFVEQPQVINGASDLLVEVFEERGRHARSAVGLAALPGGAAVEIEVIMEVSG